MPVKPWRDPSAHDRRHRGADGKNHRHATHQSLRLRPPDDITNNGAADDHAGARREALQQAEEKQLRYRHGQRASRAGQHVRGESAQDDPASAEHVGNRPVERRHDCIAEQIQTHCLLYGDVADPQIRLDILQSRVRGIQRKWTKYRQ